jgi:hypothetical protein
MGVFQFLFNKRPQVDTQNTGRDVYLRPFGVATVSLAGLGGVNNLRSIAALVPTSFNAAYTGITGVEGQGNALSDNPQLEPLIDKKQTGPQF